MSDTSGGVVSVWTSFAYSGGTSLPLTIGNFSPHEARQVVTLTRDVTISFYPGRPDPTVGEDVSALMVPGFHPAGVSLLLWAFEAAALIAAGWAE